VPVSELSKIQSKPVIVSNLKINDRIDITNKTGKVNLPCRINLSIDEIKDFSLIISNGTGEELITGFDKKQNQYFIDRTKSGKVDFQKEFAARHVAPRFTDSRKMNISLLIDVSSVELFADDGLSVMTEIFFPDKPYNQIHVQSPENILIKKLEYISLKSIWQ
jgi:fructan beta-fructosidase